MVGSQDDNLGSLADGIDPKLLQFIRTQVNSFIKWDLVRFFHENPHTADTAENIALYTGRDAKVIESELLELTEAGVLLASSISGMTIYTLGTDNEIRELVNRFLSACEDRKFRIQAMYYVIKGTS